MEVSGISTASLLPDEMILQILSNLSLKNLHRLKWVSKSWFSFITNEVLSKLVKSPNLSFYYSNYRRCTAENKSSVLFDFLPNNANEFPMLAILDCCGGLVVCSLCDDAIDPFPETTYYYICNPVDKSYNQILTPFPNPLFFMLDFNPSISPHYKVIALGRRGYSLTDLVFGIYDSKKCCFETVHVRPQRVSYIMLDKRYSALWNGFVYLHCMISMYSSIGPQLRIGPESRTMMISGILGGSNENIICKFITFPKQSMVSRMTCSSYMGTWRDRLRFVSYDEHEIRVWALRDTQEDEWALERICACSFGSIGRSYDDMPPNIVGLHPMHNAVLFIFKKLLFVYDLDQMIFENFCEIGDDAILEDDAALSPEQLVFPFSPCFAKEVLKMV